tara:strand:+ start:38 stop:277 length:240 start_codon:yes stop_codon:yes gene_type:complete
MDGTQIVETWQVFKEYLDKKHIDTVAEKFVDLCADFGTEDEAFRDALGSDHDLDKAIGYYLEEDVDDIDDNYNDIDEDY